MFYNDNISDSPQQIVDGFASFFKSSFVTSTSSFTPESGLPIASTLNIASITENDVSSALRKIKNSQTAGPDQIPSFLLRDCCVCLTGPLSKIFNLSLNTGVFPAKWKLSKVVPILKTGDKHNIANYRPISILSNF